MTEKLFEKDSMLKSCDATVVSCTPQDDKYLVVLDRTVIFPEGGGQLSDEGRINDVSVYYAAEENGEVVHYTDKPLPIGGKVKVALDWNIRLDHMQQHCGEHILSYAFWKECGANNIGFHMNKDVVTIDLDKELTEEDMLKAENFANAELWADKPVHVDYMLDVDVAKLNMRKKNEKIHGALRIVSIQDGDICTCCGTHPTSTGMIGMIKILRFEKHKEGVRVEFNCGLRTLRDMQLRTGALLETSNILSVKVDEVPAAVTKLKKEIIELVGKVKAKTLELFISQIPQIMEAAPTAANGCKVVCVAQECDAKEAKALMQLLSAQPKVIIAIVYHTGDRVNYQFALGEMAEGNCKAYCQAANEIFAGKGGGNNTFAQGGGIYTADWQEKTEKLKTIILG
jgi:alanyl-tRNA synthetase